MNIKYAFLNLTRKPVFALLTILQLIASVMLLYCAISSSHYVTTKTEDMKKVYENKNLYSIVNGYMPELGGIKAKNLEDFNKYLKTSSKFNYLLLDDDSEYIGIAKNNGQFIKAYATQTINNEDFQVVYNLKVDETFFNKFAFKVSSGRLLTNQDFTISKEGSIPVILGSSYEKFFKLGDTIKYLDYYQNPQNLKVIGFLEKGYYLADGRSPESLNLLDKYIIYPQQKITMTKDPSADIKTIEEYYKIELINNSFNGYININEKDKGKIKDIISEITLVAKNNGFAIKIVSINETIEKFKASNSKQENIIKFLLIILSIFTSIGIISSLRYSLLNQIKEFGIHIMHGAILKDLAKRVVYELLGLFIVANLISLLIITTFLKGDLILKFNLYSFAMTMILSLLFSLLLSLIPIRKIMKFTIDELVRGKE